MPTFIEAIREGLYQEMERDSNVIVLGEDVGEGGVFRATEGFVDHFGRERVIDSPLAESSIVGVSIGAALNGMRPVPEIQFSDYIHPAMNQLINEAAKIRYLTEGTFSCPITVRAPFGGGVHGGPFHSQCVEALFFHIPGLKICTPSTAEDAKGLLLSAIRDPDPVLFFEHKYLYRRQRADSLSDDPLPMGKAAIRRSGTHMTIVTYAAMVHKALEAAELADKEGVSVEVLDLRTLCPLDRPAILESVRRTNKCIVLHEDNKTGGIGGEIAGMLAEEAFEDLDGPVLRIAAPDVHFSFSSVLEQAYLPSTERILDGIRTLAAY
ncbi:MAG TPA: alpha-ketoacid dehydrogenase subunit beta [Chloroflexota bacterium]|jgi:2-oxoisovalerate dehydrogenase E1 component beta subunit|nr:alpha-ketoacid dehydrogenase subunit beta [Chloroflexota bacterium]